jgi:flagella basal body P-ring formation protein FlgA
MCLSKLSLFVLSFVFGPLLALADVQASIPKKAVEVRFAPNIQVSGERIVLGDAALVYARSMANFQALSALELARLPEGGHELRLPAEYLNQRIREALPQGTEMELSAPEFVTFHLQKIGLNERDFSADLTRIAKERGKIPEGAEIEIQPISGFERLKLVRPEGARIEAATEMPRWKGELSFRVVRADTAGEGPVWVRAKVRWFQKVWVAKKRNGFGQALDSADFELKRIETTDLHEDPVAVSRPEELAGLLKNSRARRAIAENSPLLPSQVEKRPDAMAGQPLRVIFQSESGVSVTADGALISPGTIGSEVKARLHSSKKIVVGKLVSEGVMEVNL